jgi:hypothetical protein
MRKTARDTRGVALELGVLILGAAASACGAFDGLTPANEGSDEVASSSDASVDSGLSSRPPDASVPSTDGGQRVTPDAAGAHDAGDSGASTGVDAAAHGNDGGAPENDGGVYPQSLLVSEGRIANALYDIDGPVQIIADGFSTLEPSDPAELDSNLCVSGTLASLATDPTVWGMRLSFPVNQPLGQGGPGFFDAESRGSVGFSFRFEGPSPRTTLIFRLEADIVYCTWIAGTGSHEILFEDLQQCPGPGGFQADAGSQLRTFGFIIDAHGPEENYDFCIRDLALLVQD